MTDEGTFTATMTGFTHLFPHAHKVAVVDPLQRLSVESLKQRMEEARRSMIDNMPTLYLKNPTPTRCRIARAKLLKPKFLRYR